MQFYNFMNMATSQFWATNLTVYRIYPNKRPVAETFSNRGQLLDSYKYEFSVVSSACYLPVVCRDQVFQSMESWQMKQMKTKKHCTTKNTEK